MSFDPNSPGPLTHTYARRLATGLAALAAAGTMTAAGSAPAAVGSALQGVHGD
jgi:hypothetical protein